MLSAMIFLSLTTISGVAVIIQAVRLGRAYENLIKEV